jgi:hypothetical protein
MVIVDTDTKQVIIAKHVRSHFATDRDLVETHVTSCFMKSRKSMILVILVLSHQFKATKTESQHHPVNDQVMNFQTCDQGPQSLTHQWFSN